MMQIVQLKLEGVKHKFGNIRPPMKGMCKKKLEGEIEKLKTTWDYIKSKRENEKVQRQEKEKYLKERREQIKAIETMIGMINIECLSQIPGILSKEQYEWEMKERGERKKNVFIWGFKTTGKGINEELMCFILVTLGIQMNVVNIRAIGGGLVVELA